MRKRHFIPHPKLPGIEIMSILISSNIADCIGRSQPVTTSVRRPSTCMAAMWRRPSTCGNAFAAKFSADTNFCTSVSFCLRAWETGCSGSGVPAQAGPDEEMCPPLRCQSFQTCQPLFVVHFIQQQTHPSSLCGVASRTC